MEEPTKDEAQDPVDVCEPGYFSVPAAQGLHGQFFSHACRDIDECTFVELYKCPDISNCVNTDGSFICDCEEGFYSFGEECLDINECSSDKLNDCPDDSDCVNTDGSYTCTCRDGFGMVMVGDITQCFNINECLHNDSCEFASGAVCEDTLGGFKCSCPNNMLGTGYIGDPCRKEVVRVCIVQDNYSNGLALLVQCT